MNETQVDREQFRALLFSLPKTEIHLHLEGLATVDTIWALIETHKLQFNGIKNKEDLQKKYVTNTLEEFLNVFINIVQNSFKTENDLKYLVRDAERYLLSNNIFYAEIFFAPSKFIQNGFDFKKMITILDNGAQALEKKHGIKVRYLVDASRSFGPENAMNNLNLVLKNPVKSVIGVGLGGSESQGPAKDYAEVFAYARKKGLKVVAHAGEDVDSFSIWDAVDILHAQRIGHGTSAIQDEKLMNFLAKEQIPLEICPTSNVLTRKYVKTLKDHPIKSFYDHGIDVTLNTDDPTFFGVELMSEYMNLLDSGMFTPGELLRIVKNTHFATFMPEKEKEKTWKPVQALIDASPYSIDGQ